MKDQLSLIEWLTIGCVLGFMLTLIAIAIRGQ